MNRKEKLEAFFRAASEKTVTSTYPLPEEVLTLLNELASIEIYQSSVYTQLAEEANMYGYLKAEKYFKQESNEEKEHYQGHIDYLVGRGINYEVQAIDKPEYKAGTLAEFITFALNLEKAVSDMYQEAYKKIVMLDPMTANHLLKYLTIQQDAVKFYMDAYAVCLRDSTGGLIAEEAIFG